MSEGSTQELNSLRKHRIWARCLENTPGRFSLRHGGQACCKNRCRYCYLFLLLTFAQDFVGRSCFKAGAQLLWLCDLRVTPEPVLNRVELNPQLNSFHMGSFWDSGPSCWDR